MTDFLSRLADRSMRLMPQVEPLVASRYATRPAASGLSELGGAKSDHTFGAETRSLNTEASESESQPADTQPSPSPPPVASSIPADLDLSRFAPVTFPTTETNLSSRLETRHSEPGSAVEAHESLPNQVPMPPADSTLQHEPSSSANLSTSPTESSSESAAETVQDSYPARAVTRNALSRPDLLWGHSVAPLEKASRPIRGHQVDSIESEQGRIPGAADADVDMHVPDVPHNAPRVTSLGESASHSKVSLVETPSQTQRLSEKPMRSRESRLPAHDAVSGFGPSVVERAIPSASTVANSQSIGVTGPIEPAQLTNEPVAPVIRVTIGRLEVRAILPPTPAVDRPTSVARTPSIVSLDEYLKRSSASQR